MGWYRRSKFALDALRTFTSKIVPKHPAQQPISRINPYTLNNPRASGFSLFSPALSKRVLLPRTLGFQAKKQHHPYSSTLPDPWTSSRRCYYVDSQQVRHFKRRGFARYLAHPKVVFIVLVVGSGIVVSLYLGISETIPYTKRKHFVILSKSDEIRRGESQFKKIKEARGGRTLPAQDPDSVRVRSIAEGIFLAVQRGLRKDKAWTDLSYDEGSGGWDKQDEIIDDDKWVQVHQSKKKEKKIKGTHEYATGHLEGLNWEVMILNEPIVNAICLPGGKIIVYTGLLKYCKTDAELATVIGHEVAHAVARHLAERYMKVLWFNIVQLVLYQFVTQDVAKKMSKYLLKLPFSRRMELEADYIGLLLMASAGYDPREAPMFWEKMGKLQGKMAFEDYLSTHPSNEKRAKLLAEAKVMQEALDIYREAMAGREVEGFFL